MLSIPNPVICSIISQDKALPFMVIIILMVKNKKNFGGHSLYQDAIIEDDMVNREHTTWNIPLPSYSSCKEYR